MKCVLIHIKCKTCNFHAEIVSYFMNRAGESLESRKTLKLINFVMYFSHETQIHVEKVYLSRSDKIKS